MHIKRLINMIHKRCRIRRDGGVSFDSYPSPFFIHDRLRRLLCHKATYVT
jgi:hypothetical protein